MTDERLNELRRLMALNDAAGEDDGPVTPEQAAAVIWFVDHGCEAVAELLAEVQLLRAATPAPVSVDRYLTTDRYKAGPPATRKVWKGEGPAPEEILQAAAAVRAGLRATINAATLHLNQLDAELRSAGFDVTKMHPDWPDRVGSQVLDEAQTLERATERLRWLLGRP